MALTTELTDLATQVEAAYTTTAPDPWATSPFKFLRTLPSRTRGAAGETLIEKWATTAGLTVTRPTSTDYDRGINDHRVEIKLSTLWAEGTYRFQQIRDQDYDHVLALGISPHDVHAWLIPKTVLKEHVIGHLGQHTGASGADTAWFTVDPTNPPAWLTPYGATLDHVATLLGA